MVRLFHGRMSDDCLCNPDVSDIDIDQERRTIWYEGGLVSTHARSLWRIELTKTKWFGSHIRLGQPFRLRHMCSGKFLRVSPDQQRTLELCMDFEAADESTVFCFRWAKDKLEAFGDEEGFDFDFL